MQNLVHGLGWDKATRQLIIAILRSITEEKPEFEHDVPHPVVSTKQVRPPNGPMTKIHRPHQPDPLMHTQVETFLSALVNETAIAELQLQVC